MTQENHNLKRRIIVIGEEEELRSLLVEFYTCNHFEITCFNLVTEAKAALSAEGKLEGLAEQGKIDLLIADTKTVQRDGVDALKSLQTQYPQIPVLLLTPFKGQDVAIEAMEKDLPTLAELEEKYIRHVLNKTGGKKEKAAKILGLNRRTLYRKEREYGWVKEDRDGSDTTLSSVVI